MRKNKQKTNFRLIKPDPMLSEHDRLESRTERCRTDEGSSQETETKIAASATGLQQNKEPDKILQYKQEP